MSATDRLLQAVGAIGMGLIPGPNHSLKEQYLWRVRVGLVVCGTFSGLLGVSLLAFGSAKWTGFDGFARTSAIVALVQQRDADREETLDTRIVDLRIKHCAAPTGEGRQLYWGKLAPKMDEYTALTHRAYNLPDCKDL